MEASTDLSQLVSNVLPQNNTSPVTISRNNSISTPQSRTSSQSVASSLPDQYQSGFDLTAPQPPPQLVLKIFLNYSSSFYSFLMKKIFSNFLNMNFQKDSKNFFSLFSKTFDLFLWNSILHKLFVKLYLYWSVISVYIQKLFVSPQSISISKF